MKQTSDFQKIQDAMQPGILSHTGFLGPDPRPLTEVLDTDHAAVLRRGHTHPQLAAFLLTLQREARRGLGLPVHVHNRFEVRADSVRGRLPCPFGHPGLYPKDFTEVTELATGRAISFTALGLHLIEAHGFYGGRGAPYRVDPDLIADWMDSADT